MNGVLPIQQIGSQTDTKTGSVSKSLNKDDFLNLLVTQLKNQDPLKPNDPTEFTAQLAQFSSLEQLYNINENMKALDDLKGMFGRLSALSLLDKQVVINSDNFDFDGQKVELGVRFQDPMQEANFYVKNDSGQILDQIRVSMLSNDEYTMQWDGKTQDGLQLPPGTYFLSVIGTTSDGKEIQGMPLVGSRVAGLDFSDSSNTNTLLTANGKFMLSEIFRVNNLTLSGESQK